MLDNFVKKFTDSKINYVKIKNNYFLENKSLEKYRLDRDEDIFGLFLGEEKSGEFIPSFGLLEILTKHTNEKIIVNDMGEIDFLYKKNMRTRHVLEIKGKKMPKTLKLVQNKFDENLGYGQLAGNKNNKQVLKHILDRGLFLKREL